MVNEEIKLPDIESLSILSGLPEGILAGDIVEHLHKDLIKLGKPEKEASDITGGLVMAFKNERDKVVEACYLAGYLKGMSDMALRFKHLIDSRGGSGR